MDNRLKLRRGQTITTFGPGSLVDFEGIGYFVNDVGQWPRPTKPIDLPRLQNVLRGKDLRGFPDDGASDGIPVALFPKWFHCPKCKSLRHVTKPEGKQLNGRAPTCNEARCNSTLSPMRFVAYCDNGHLAEINWDRWAHGDKDEVAGACGGGQGLTYHAGGQGGGDFTEMFVKCKGCGARRDFSELFTKPLNRKYVGAQGQKCSGRQPSLPFGTEPELCDKAMKVEPRGSTSIYRAKTISALDIDAPEQTPWGAAPEFSNEELFLGEQCLERIERSFPLKPAREEALEDFLYRKQQPDNKLRGPLGDMLSRVAGGERRVEEILRHILERERSESEPLSTVGEPGSTDAEGISIEGIQTTIRDDELRLFKDAQDISTENLVVEFEAVKPESFGSQVADLMTSIGKVRRLREVQAFLGFTRGKATKVQKADISKARDWVYANEGFGEGIYFELNSVTISSYLATFAESIEKITGTQLKHIARYKEDGGIELPESVVFTIAHTLSHFLIRQLTFVAGYSSSALRERIYFDDSEPYAGILIYTTEADAEGTLGGLVDVAVPEKLTAIIETVFESASWCSADPVCRETERQGIGGLNHSSCHCCSLVAETSCEYQNAVLNRLLLCGRGSESEPVGFLTMINREAPNADRSS